jgi:glucosamine-phosphate N-acetyltransferase
MSFTIREIKGKDIEQGGLLDVLKMVAPVGNLSKSRAKKILTRIRSNPLHRIFVAVIPKAKTGELVIGTTTLLVEPKFIFNGARVGHIEDVAVKSEYQGLGVGFALVKHATEKAASMGCLRTILDCSDENRGFYEKLGYTYFGNCMKVQHE